MDRNTQSYWRKHGDVTNPDNANVNLAPKELDLERFDSGICSFNSIDSQYASGNSITLEQVMTTQLSGMSLNSSTATRNSSMPSTNKVHHKPVNAMDDCIDYGYHSVNNSEECSHSKENIPEPDSKESSETNVADFRWYLPDKEGDSYLQLAIIHKKVDIVFEIIQTCTLPDLLDIANREQQSALHLSVLTNQPVFTRCLVAYGANIRCKDRQGNTPLHLACEKGFASHIEMLTAKLAPEEDPGLPNFSLPQDVNERNYSGFTPLHLAVMNGHTHIVDMLINQLKCNVNITDLKSGRTALHHAVERRNMEITALILKAEADVNALTYDDCSPLHLAAARGLRREAQMLLDCGADLFLITRGDYDVFELSGKHARLTSLLRDAERKEKSNFGCLQPTTVSG